MSHTNNTRSQYRDEAVNGGVHDMTRSLARTLAVHGVRINTIAPDRSAMLLPAATVPDPPSVHQVQ
jgi:NAD(P)-dependent dehydrogenase (short-subunit alcohol dehydrogenase family)